MTINSEQIQALKAAAERATALDLDSAQIERGNDGYYECPVCCGAGEVEAKTDFCNIDGVALGVQFYGIGEHHGAAEIYFRAAKPAVILSLLAERDADKALIAESVVLFETMRQRIAELEASHSKLRGSMADIHNTIRLDGTAVSLSALLSASKRAYEESAAAGMSLRVGGE